MNDDWGELDDTLADGPSPGAVPEASKPWLAEQRFLHGLLRALHTADAAGRESRIESLLSRIDAERAAGPVRRRHWLLVAASAALLATAALWFVLPPDLPTAAAAVDRAVAHLARDVDRRFRVEISAEDAAGKSAFRQEFALVTRPGMRFRIDGKLAFGTMQLGEFRIGCDGQELWLLPANGILPRRAAPLADRDRLLAGLGDVLDLGYLDVHDLVRKLPEDLALRVTGREAGEHGRPMLRIEAVGQGDAAARLRSAWLLCDEATGMVTAIEVERSAARGRGPVRKLRLQYLGEESPGFVDYRKPW